LKVNRITWDYGTSGNLSFSEGNRTLIRSAMNLVRDRIDSNAVWACANDNNRRWMVHNSGQNVSTLQRFESWNRLNQRGFVNTNEIGVDFTPFNEAGNTMGRAYVGGFVRSELASTGGLVETYALNGRFAVMLNLANLNDSYWRNKPEVWAG